MSIIETYGTFTFKCEYGCTVSVVDGKPKPHDCAGVTVALDAWHFACHAGETQQQGMQRVVDALKPIIREANFLKCGRCQGHGTMFDPDELRRGLAAVVPCPDCSGDPS
jgi:hypothetical protein